MLKRTYDIEMQTPLGKRAGTLEVQLEGEQLKGHLNLLKRWEPFEGSIDGNGYCSIRGTLVTLMSTIPYTATGRMTPDALELSLEGGENRFPVTGTIRQEE